MLVRAAAVTLEQLHLRCDRLGCEARFIPTYPIEDEQRLRRMAARRRWLFPAGKDYCSPGCAELATR